MGRHEWYRNTAWDSVIEAEFRNRLNRSRAGNRPQYLRIQASYLRESHPQVAVGLLDDYFALGDHLDLAQAHVDRANALLALGNVAEALASYEAALQRERAFPNYRTGADLELACLIAWRACIAGRSRFLTRELMSHGFRSSRTSGTGRVLLSLPSLVGPTRPRAPLRRPCAPPS